MSLLSDLRAIAWPVRVPILSERHPIGAFGIRAEGVEVPGPKVQVELFRMRSGFGREDVLEAHHGEAYEGVEGGQGYEG